MLPKVANHILNHTSRAVLAIQNQSGHTIRNVLQLQSSSGPTAGNLGTRNGNSSGSGSSSGAGGAKQHAGGRYYTGYSGAGRAVAQADPAFQPSDVDCSEDGDDSLSKQSGRPGHKPRRIRSRSLSLVHSDPDFKYGVLKAVQVHVRSRHAFATPPLLTNAVDSDARPGVAPAIESSPAQSQRELSQDDSRNGSFADERAAFDTINEAQATRNIDRIVEAVKEVRSRKALLTTAAFNSMLDALRNFRRPGDSLTVILETYKEMLARSIAPNFRTYYLLILAFTERDHEAHKAIAAAEIRMRRRTSVGQAPSAAQASDEQLISRLHAENNFGSAMTLFHAGCALSRQKPDIFMYSNLLRSCARHANIDGAIQVFAHLEKRSDLKPTAVIYGHLLTAYANAGDLQGAKEVFDEFLRAVKENRIDEFVRLDRPHTDHHARVAVWNKMIRAYFTNGQPAGAIGLLEQMMDSTTNASLTAGHVPAPAPSTFTRIITGFCDTGDVASALIWFDRLLQQEASPGHSYDSSDTPTRPEAAAWTVILDGLAKEGMVSELNRIFTLHMETAARDNRFIQDPDRLLVVQANLHYLDTHPEIDNAKGIEIVDFAARHAFRTDNMFFGTAVPRQVADSLFRRYMQYGRPDRAVDVLEEYVSTELRLFHAAEQKKKGQFGDAIHYRMTQLRGMLAVAARVCKASDKVTPLPLRLVVRLAALVDDAGLTTTHVLGAFYPLAYARAKAAGEEISLSKREWELLLLARLYHDTALPGGAQQNDPVEWDPESLTLPQLLADMDAAGIIPTELDLKSRNKVTSTFLHFYTMDAIKELLSGVNPLWLELFPNVQAASDKRVQVPADREAPLDGPKVSDIGARIDGAHSAFVDEHFYAHETNVSPLTAFNRFESGIRSGRYVNPEVAARLIATLGRIGELQKVRAVYDATQVLLAAMDYNKERQSAGWFRIEDAMIVALAHGGDPDAAHIHRTRIIQQGGTPSADAYGALIQCVKDTTDDTTNAMALFEDAVARKVSPNIFLFNTIISKLAKARKADQALDLFLQMKAHHVNPTSVTYGTVIAACCRVGDAQSAETLFVEMTEQGNFKPRVPPYNTMMQFYAHTKPNRERVLYYYHALQEARVQPTAHTYKLLIDAYGAIEPVDFSAMEEVFAHLVADRKVDVQGTHWASLINAYGCVGKDLDKAIAVFESIGKHPSTRKTKAPLPDAVVFEALFNVLVTLHRTDLLATYNERRAACGVHMTAYIANLLIKGSSIAGDIEQARRVFESLLDPPQGVAAPNNHVAHFNGSDRPDPVPASAPVYREPSTWEVMVRSELRNGNRDAALKLLERLKARGFPPAVEKRISGIMMLDDSVSPWASPPSGSP